MIYKVGNVVKWAYSEREWVIAEIQQGEFLHLISMNSVSNAVNVHKTEVKFLASCVSNYVARIAGV